MAIVTAVNRPRGQTRGGLRAVLRYVMKEERPPIRTAIW